MKNLRILFGIMLALLALATTTLAQMSTNDIRQFGGHRVRNDEINWANGERPLIVEESTILTMDRGKLGMVPVRFEPGDTVLGYLKRSDSVYDYYTTSRFQWCGNKTIGEIRVKRKSNPKVVQAPAPPREERLPPPLPPTENHMTMTSTIYMGDTNVNVTSGGGGAVAERPLPRATIIAGLGGGEGVSLSYAAGSKFSNENTAFGGNGAAAAAAAAVGVTAAVTPTSGAAAGQGATSGASSGGNNNQGRGRMRIRPPVRART
jgi:hypothetical protein